MIKALINNISINYTLPLNDLADDHLNELFENDKNSELKKLYDENTQIKQLLTLIFNSSAYLTRLIKQYPNEFLHYLQSVPETIFDELLDELKNKIYNVTELNEIMAFFREFKLKATLLISIADICNYWDIMKAIDYQSKLATNFTNMAVRWLLLKETQRGNFLPKDEKEPEKASGYIVLALGKLGANELNYSSDIDLIIFFNSDNAPIAENKEPTTFFIKLTKNLIKILGEQTMNGYVYRTDLRLRPDPSSTKIAISINAAEHYYLTYGQNWERSAMIKATPIAGDIELGIEFLKVLKPFIWRKYLDFASISDIYSIKQRIHTHKNLNSNDIYGKNIKLGHNGIRDIEFFVQAQQLIAGGRTPELRTNNTLKTLKKLTENNWIDKKAENELSQAYIFLRYIEQRLQMLNDEQTYNLPKDDDTLLNFVQFLGYKDINAFAKELDYHQQNIDRHYSALFKENEAVKQKKYKFNFSGNETNPEIIEELFNLGFKKPEEVIKIVRGWFFARYPATRSEKSRARLTEILPLIIEYISKTEDPDLSLYSFDEFVASLPSGVQLFSLLSTHPHILQLLTLIIGSAPRLAKTLSQRPRTLEAVIAAEFYSPLPNQVEYSKIYDDFYHSSASYEDHLDKARIFGKEQLFRIGTLLLTNNITGIEAGHAYSALASTLTSKMLNLSQTYTEEIYGYIKDGQSAVIAMGKMGGMEMSARSDLDIIIIYDYDNSENSSDGKKPVSPQFYYTKLTQRLISTLSAPTSEGSLYEVDMRLRPSGRSGPVATNIESFYDYQKNSAETWEKMALTRARVISPNSSLKTKIQTIINEVLSLKQDEAQIAKDVLNMRNLIEQEKPSKGIWDLKYVRGGIIDLEFINQYFKLIYAHKEKEILTQNTLSSLYILKEKKLINNNDAQILIDAISLYTNISQIMRLCIDKPLIEENIPHSLKTILAQSQNLPEFENLKAYLIETENNVKEIFNQTFL